MPGNIDFPGISSGWKLGVSTCILRPNKLPVSRPWKHEFLKTWKLGVSTSFHQPMKLLVSNMFRHTGNTLHLGVSLTCETSRTPVFTGHGKENEKSKFQEVSGGFPSPRIFLVVAVVSEEWEARGRE